MKKEKFTYEKSGVNINAADNFVKFISSISSNKKGKKKFNSIGGFGSITNIPKNLKNPKIVACTDGVGTKVEIANLLNKYDTIGIDLVAMSVNDLIVQGARPLLFLDYISINKIDLKKVSGSGKEGRVLKGDLISMMGENPQPSERKIKYGQEERIKMSRLRQTIAKRLKQAQENAALLTTFNEVDMTGIMEMRKENQEDFQSRYGIKLGFMSFFVKACVAALKMYPSVNAEIDGDEIIYKNYYNMSFAVGTEKGLVVPVLRDADQLSFADIEKNIKTISEKARDGKITIEDLQGGTFTISNGGVYGSMLSTPILNLPQSGVLGMHNIVERPMVVDGEIKIRPIMYLALSYDHRIIDGKESVSFLKMVKENLEDPRRLFLNI